MIGLLTPYKVNNYGTKLQAYAVQEIFKRYDDVEIIEYVPNIIDRVVMKFKSLFHDYSQYSDIKDFKGQCLSIDAELLKVRNKSINSFDKKLIISKPIVGYSNLRKRGNSYAHVVCGSDQIWNPVNLKPNIYMLEFVKERTKTIAFAPSFGVPELPKKLKNVYKKKISRIEYLSVREKNGCSIINNLGRSDVFWCLDPTLVLGEKKWKDVSDESTLKIDGDYIFCYFLGKNEYSRKSVLELASKNKLKVVNLPHFKGYCEADDDFGDLNLYNVTPQDFLSLIRKARFVCTDSFHGTVFSLLFHTPFYCFERHIGSAINNTNNRIASLLDMFSMSDRIVLNGVFSSKPINFELADAMLAKKVNEVELFLKKSLRRN